MNDIPLPVPPHFRPEKVGEIWKVEYEKLAEAATRWADEHQIQPAVKDHFRLCLICVDIQNTFCIPGFELYVGGRSGTGAVDDNRRLCDFIYRNLSYITQIVPTLDTHQAMQIFHALFFVNDKGEHPEPYTLVTVEDISSGRWRFNEALSEHLGRSAEYVQRFVEHYTRQLKEGGKYELTIWPYHSMLGSIGHALLPAVEEAVFFHTICRYSQPEFQIKGNHALTEHYSVFGPEVSSDPDGQPLVKKNEALFQKMIDFDAIIIAGQAKSHCVAWTIADLLDNFMSSHASLVEKVYLLEDCSSPVVVPGVVDYTDDANRAFQRFSEAGMHVVRSTEPLTGWPGVMRQLSDS